MGIHSRARPTIGPLLVSTKMSRALTCPPFQKQFLLGMFDTSAGCKSQERL